MEHASVTATHVKTTETLITVNDGGHQCSHVNEGLAVGPSNHIVRACIDCLSYVQSCVVLLLYGASAAG